MKKLVAATVFLGWIGCPHAFADSCETIIPGASADSYEGPYGGYDGNGFCHSRITTSEADCRDRTGALFDYFSPDHGKGFTHCIFRIPPTSAPTRSPPSERHETPSSSGADTGGRSSQSSAPPQMDMPMPNPPQEVVEAYGIALDKEHECDSLANSANLSAAAKCYDRAAKLYEGTSDSEIYDIDRMQKKAQEMRRKILAAAKQQAPQPSSGNSRGGACPQDPSTCVSVKPLGQNLGQYRFKFVQVCDGVRVRFLYDSCSARSCTKDTWPWMVKGETGMMYNGMKYPEVSQVECLPYH